MKKILSLTLLFTCGCSWYAEDNLAEEIVEEIVEYKTGAQIDLTPWSPEN